MENVRELLKLLSGGQLTKRQFVAFALRFGLFQHSNLNTEKWTWGEEPLDDDDYVRISSLIREGQFLSFEDIAKCLSTTPEGAKKTVEKATNLLLAEHRFGYRATKMTREERKKAYR